MCDVEAAGNNYSQKRIYFKNMVLAMIKKTHVKLDRAYPNKLKSQKIYKWQRSINPTLEIQNEPKY